MDDTLAQLFVLYQRFSPLATIALFAILGSRFRHPVARAFCWGMAIFLGVGFVFFLWSTSGR